MSYISNQNTVTQVAWVLFFVCFLFYICGDLFYYISLVSILSIVFIFSAVGRCSGFCSTLIAKYIIVVVLICLNNSSSFS